VGWAQGEVVVLREIWKGRIWKARPWRVVRDAPDELVLHIPPSTPTKVPPGSGIPRDDWELEDKVWRREALRVTRPGDAHSILLWWEDGRRLDEWYVNLERPLRRSPVGFDYLDLELDILCFPDRSWQLHDEDEFDEAQRRGVLSPGEAAAVRAEAERVIAAWPFPTGWENFRPDPAWTPPQFPDGWEVVERPSGEAAKPREP
jgi:hypothetical protein